MSRVAFSSSIFCVHQSRVLLIRHKLLNKYLPIGGELEAGETPLECAKRELHEETGYIPEDVSWPVFPVPSGTPPGLLGYEEHDAGAKGRHLNFCFMAYVTHQGVKTDGSWDNAVWHPIFEDLDNSYDMYPMNVIHNVFLIRNVIRFGYPTLANACG